MHPALTFDPEMIEASDFPTIGELITNRFAVSREATVKSVSDAFFADDELDAVAVVENDKPVSLVTRTKFLFTVFRQFGWEVYQRKTIDALADPNALVLSDWSRLDAALALALKRGAKDLYDEVIVVDEEGRFLGMLSVRQMVLQQSHALANIIVQKELAHERARELEEVDRLKSQFLANVTHELRSPVNAIIELAELIRLAAENGFVGQARDRLTLLLSSATSLRSVITNMLDLSKIEAGRMRVIVEPLELASLLEEVTNTARVLVGAKPVAVELVTERPSTVMVSDPVKIRQVVLNLASNAAKFTDEGTVTIRQTSTPSEVTIAVEDTGVGIRPEDLEKLFIAFSQVEDAHVKSREGTGLGLAITKELVHLLEGRVAVASEPGKGSTFTVILPKEMRHE